MVSSVTITANNKPKIRAILKQAVVA